MSQLSSRFARVVRENALLQRMARAELRRPPSYDSVSPSLPNVKAPASLSLADVFCNRPG